MFTELLLYAKHHTTHGAGIHWQARGWHLATRHVSFCVCSIADYLSDLWQIISPFHDPVSSTEQYLSHWTWCVLNEFIHPELLVQTWPWVKARKVLVTVIPIYHCNPGSQCCCLSHFTEKEMQVESGSATSLMASHCQETVTLHTEVVYLQKPEAEQQCLEEINVGHHTVLRSASLKALGFTSYGLQAESGWARCISSIPFM